MLFPSVGSLRINNWDQSAAIHSSGHLVAVPVNRDSSNILLLSSDVESDPGLRLPDENPIYCIICSAKIKRGIQQETAPSCTETNCQLRSHQACNGLTVAQTRHAKSCG